MVVSVLIGAVGVWVFKRRRCSVKVSEASNFAPAYLSPEAYKIACEEFAQRFKAEINGAEVEGSVEFEFDPQIYPYVADHATSLLKDTIVNAGARRYVSCSVSKRTLDGKESAEVIVSWSA